jgi:hypothetical protein
LACKEIYRDCTFVQTMAEEKNNAMKDDIKALGE